MPASHLSSKCRRLLRLATLAVLIIAVGIAVDRSVTAPAPPEHHGVEDHFSILRSPPEEARSRNARRGLKNLTILKAHPLTSKIQLGSRQRGGLWIIPTKRQLCLSQQRGVSCAPKRAAINNGIVLGTFRPPTSTIPAPHDFLVQGLVPDDVKRVLAIVGHHRQVVIDVNHNLFSIERDEPVNVARLLHH